MLQPADIDDAEVWRRQLEDEKLAALAELAAGAGHEINNPLAVICGRAELLLRQETHPERRRDLATIHAQARRVYEMIADLMLFARPPEPTLAVVDLSALLRELQGELKARSDDRGIEVKVRCQGEPLRLQADAAHLLVALRAVCDNALDVLPPGGQLEIVAERARLRKVENLSDAIQIEIRDNGPGFGEEARRHLFDPFFSGRAAGRGLGMGLAKSWRIVQMHGGTIDAVSPGGCGAAFVITLPLGESALVEADLPSRVAT
jgi:signal transduction histidine kinase